MAKKQKDNKLTKAQKKVRKAPLGTGIVKKTSTLIQKRQNRQKKMLDELF